MKPLALELSKLQAAANWALTQARELTARVAQLRAREERQYFATVLRRTAQ